MIKELILTPFQKFIKLESFSGILLFLASVVALVWANSPLGDLYRDLWNYHIGFRTETFELYKPLILWINDGLMAIFFFVIGLEVKRELILGELNSPKKFAFPLIGAIGGIVFPVLIFVLLNNNPETLKGWAIPMATDIAFALAIIKVLGDKVPLSLKVFLTAFAIVDDIAAVLVIAIFYSSSINLVFLLIAFILLLLVYFLTYMRMYSHYFAIVIAVVVWFMFYYSGIHPTLAGVFMAFAVPIRKATYTQEFLTKTGGIIEELKQDPEDQSPILSKMQMDRVHELEDLVKKYQSPLQKLEHHLHDWVAFFIMPVFALANAGVHIGGAGSLDSNLVLKISVALVVGKCIGIASFVELAKRLNVVAFSKEINRQHIIGIAFIAGVGFTMSIFIAGLAFGNQQVYLDSSKIGILVGSLFAGVIGYLVLRFNKVKT